MSVAHQQQDWLPEIAPDPRTARLIGFLRAMVRNPISAIPHAAYEQDLVVQTLAGTRIVYVSSPALLEEILIKRPHDFPKSVVDERILRPAFGNSLLIARGDDWRWKRRLAAPYFAPAALAKTMPNMMAPFEALADTWRSRTSDKSIDVSEAMTDATLEVIGKTLFTDPDPGVMDTISRAITNYLMPISWTITFASFGIPSWVPHPGFFQMRRAQREVRAAVRDLVRSRRATSAEHNDICADLMQATDPETGRPLSEDDLLDMLLTLMAAGHETSANALTWALYCLAAQRSLQETLRVEAHQVVGNRSVAAADLTSLVTTEAFVKETMRLFPPAPIMARRTTRAETLGACHCPPGTTLFLPIYAVQRHRSLWTNPDAFDLNRFLGEPAKPLRRTVYMPFGAGPRICIGGTFAMMEMVGALATLLSRVRVSIGDETRCEPIQRITLRPKGGMWLGVQGL